MYYKFKFAQASYLLRLNMCYLELKAVAVAIHIPWFLLWVNLAHDVQRDVVVNTATNFRVPYRSDRQFFSWKRMILPNGAGLLANSSTYIVVTVNFMT